MWPDCGCWATVTGMASLSARVVETAEGLIWTLQLPAPREFYYWRQYRAPKIFHTSTRLLSAALLNGTPPGARPRPSEHRIQGLAVVLRALYDLEIPLGSNAKNMQTFSVSIPPKRTARRATGHEQPTNDQPRPQVTTESRISLDIKHSVSNFSWQPTFGSIWSMLYTE